MRKSAGRIVVGPATGFPVHRVGFEAEKTIIRAKPQCPIVILDSNPYNLALKLHHRHKLLTYRVFISNAIGTIDPKDSPSILKNSIAGEGER